MTRIQALRLRKTEKAQEREINKILSTLKKDINISIKKRGEGSLTYVERALNRFEKDYYKIITNKNLKVGTSAIKSEKKALTKYLGRITPSMYSVLSNIEDKYLAQIAKVISRKSLLDGLTVADRIKTIKGGGLKTVKNIIDVGVKSGKSWVDVAKNIDKYIDPTSQQTRVSPWKFYRKKFGEKSSFHIKKAKIPRGTVSYNAHRIARTEIAETWRQATFAYNKDAPWTEGFEITRTGGRPCEICDGLVEDNPHKDTSEIYSPHPNCYSKDTEVYTDKGWKYFYDLDGNERFLSLMPENFNLEYLPAICFIKDKFKGKLISFKNRGFDLLVTPNHRMFINDDFISAERVNNNSHKWIFRSSYWKGEHQQYIQIGNYKIEMGLFCEFLGYWLSEGCAIKRGDKWFQISISQSIKNKKNRIKIKRCLEKLPPNIREDKNGFYFNDSYFGKYLLRFGKSYEKYIPEKIKSLSSYYLRVFLDAYNLGDGSKKGTKNWKGGNFRDEITYFTSSKRMADDLGEIIIKVGHRPSYYLQKNKGKGVKHKNGEYIGNHDIWIIRECYSQRTPLHKLKKKFVEYNDYVYDVQLPINNTLLVRRNGKVCWSGNCLCYITTVRVPYDEAKDAIDNWFYGEVEKLDL